MRIPHKSLKIRENSGNKFLAAFISLYLVTQKDWKNACLLMTSENEDFVSFLITTSPVFSTPANRVDPWINLPCEKNGLNNFANFMNYDKYGLLGIVTTRYSGDNINGIIYRELNAFNIFKYAYRCIQNANMTYFVDKSQKKGKYDYPGYLVVPIPTYAAVVPFKDSEATKLSIIKEINLFYCSCGNTSKFFSSNHISFNHASIEKYIYKDDKYNFIPKGQIELLEPRIYSNMNLIHKSKGRLINNETF